MRGSTTRGSTRWPEDGRDAEELVEDLGSVLHDIGAYAQKALPGALNGAMTGASVGGPWGALVGGLAGGGASLLGGGQAAPVTPTAPAMPATLVPPAQPTLQGVISNPAALQLVLSLLKPEVLQALLGLAVQGPQAPPVRVGQTQVPVAAFANLVQSLSERALAIHHAQGGAEQAGPAYAEHLGTRAAMPDARADALLALLANSERPRSRRAVLDEPAGDPADFQDLIDIYRYGDLD